MSDHCAEAKVPRRTYYNWLNNPVFVQWWTDEVNKYFARQLPQVHKATIDAATGHKPSYGSQDRKLFYERFDKEFVPASRKEITGELAITADQWILDLMDKRRAALAKKKGADDAPPT